MNSLIIQRFNAIEEQLLQSDVVCSYQLIRKEVTQQSGKIRLKALTQANTVHLENTVFIGKTNKANLKAVGIVPLIILNCQTRRIINIMQICLLLECLKTLICFIF